MLFNSNVFVLFFAAFLLLYYLVRQDLRLRNGLIVVASYVFYGWWDYRFLSLLLFSSVMDYGVGLAMDRTERPAHRKAWLSVSLVGNLGLLGFFKYYDFFATSLTELLAKFHIAVQPYTLGLILPVGISFYTFQTMSYVIDVYRRQLKATPSLIDFLAYVSFFPQLVAGPIERGMHLLPQFACTRSITASMIQEGLWLILWGMFKKVVVADNLGPLVDMVYGYPQTSGPLVGLATVAFAFQIYSDFSGYSDIARGTAKVLGFDIMVNFNLPYVAANLREFWQRWHISLSTWLRDYLYISLGGNRCGPGRTYLNLLLTMFLGGLWHGAAGHFALWGLWHGLGLIGYRWWHERVGSSIQMPRWLGWLGTILFVGYGWLLFRAESWTQVTVMTKALGNLSTPPWWHYYLLNLVVFSLPLVVMQWWQYRTQNLLAPLTLPVWAQSILQGSLLVAILLFWGKTATPFIYFQF